MQPHFAAADPRTIAAPVPATLRRCRCTGAARFGGSQSCRRQQRRTSAHACRSPDSCDRRDGVQASRRSALALLRHGAAAAAAAAALGLPAGAAAAAALAEEQLPKGYQDLSSRLVKALREAIETDMSEASEREVRRRADGAKGLVREWLANWRDSPMVTSSDSHRQLTGTIQELGQFYMKNGQRARMSSTAGKALLQRLDAAAVSLPP